MEAERPEPEEYWNNRQFDDMHRQELNSCLNCIHNDTCISCQSYSNHEEREQKATNEPQALPMLDVRNSGGVIINQDFVIKKEVRNAGWDGYSFDAPNDQYILYTECQTKIIRRFDWQQAAGKIEIEGINNRRWSVDKSIYAFRELIKCD